jgi:hypothetical protein
VAYGTPEVGSAHEKHMLEHRPGESHHFWFEVLSGEDLFGILDGEPVLFPPGEGRWSVERLYGRS